MSGAEHAEAVAPRLEDRIPSTRPKMEFEVSCSRPRNLDGTVIRLWGRDGKPLPCSVKGCDKGAGHAGVDHHMKECGARGVLRCYTGATFEGGNHFAHVSESGEVNFETIGATDVRLPDGWSARMGFTNWDTGEAQVVFMCHDCGAAATEDEVFGK